LILAAWYKKKVMASLLSETYVDKNKVQGLQDNPLTPDAIWTRYVESFKKGAFNLVREEADPFTDEHIPRKYFSGGMDFAQGLDAAMQVQAQAPAVFPSVDQAMVVRARVEVLKAAELKKQLGWPGREYLLKDAFSLDEDSLFQQVMDEIGANDIEKDIELLRTLKVRGEPVFDDNGAQRFKERSRSHIRMRLFLLKGVLSFKEGDQDRKFSVTQAADIASTVGHERAGGLFREIERLVDISTHEEKPGERFTGGQIARILRSQGTVDDKIRLIGHLVHAGIFSRQNMANIVYAKGSVERKIAYIDELMAQGGLTGDKIVPLVQNKMNEEAVEMIRVRQRQEAAELQERIEARDEEHRKKKEALAALGPALRPGEGYFLATAFSAEESQAFETFAGRNEGQDEDVVIASLMTLKAAGQAVFAPNSARRFFQAARHSMGVRLMLLKALLSYKDDSGQRLFSFNSGVEVARIISIARVGTVLREVEQMIDIRDAGGRQVFSGRMIHFMVLNDDEAGQKVALIDYLLAAGIFSPSNISFIVYDSGTIAEKKGLVDALLARQLLNGEQITDLVKRKAYQPAQREWLERYLVLREGDKMERVARDNEAVRREQEKEARQQEASVSKQDALAVLSAGPDRKDLLGEFFTPEEIHGLDKLIEGADMMAPDDVMDALEMLTSNGEKIFSGNSVQRFYKLARHHFRVRMLLLRWLLFYRDDRGRRLFSLYAAVDIAGAMGMGRVKGLFHEIHTLMDVRDADAEGNSRQFFTGKQIRNILFNKSEHQDKLMLITELRRAGIFTAGDVADIVYMRMKVSDKMDAVRFFIQKEHLSGHEIVLRLRELADAKRPEEGLPPLPEVVYQVDRTGQLDIERQVRADEQAREEAAAKERALQGIKNASLAAGDGQGRLQPKASFKAREGGEAGWLSDYRPRGGAEPFFTRRNIDRILRAPLSFREKQERILALADLKAPNGEFRLSPEDITDFLSRYYAVDMPLFLRIWEAFQETSVSPRQIWEYMDDLPMFRGRFMLWERTGDIDLWDEVLVREKYALVNGRDSPRDGARPVSSGQVVKLVAELFPDRAADMQRQVLSSVQQEKELFSRLDPRTPAQNVIIKMLLGSYDSDVRQGIQDKILDWLKEDGIWGQIHRQLRSEYPDQVQEKMRMAEEYIRQYPWQYKTSDWQGFLKYVQRMRLPLFRRQIVEWGVLPREREVLVAASLAGRSPLEILSEAIRRRKMGPDKIIPVLIKQGILSQQNYQVIAQAPLLQKGWFGKGMTEDKLERLVSILNESRRQLSSRDVDKIIEATFPPEFVRSVRAKIPPDRFDEVMEEYKVYGKEMAAEAPEQGSLPVVTIELVTEKGTKIFSAKADSIAQAVRQLAVQEEDVFNAVVGVMTSSGEYRVVRSERKSEESESLEEDLEGWDTSALGQFVYAFEAGLRIERPDRGHERREIAVQLVLGGDYYMVVGEQLQSAVYRLASRNREVHRILQEYAESPGNFSLTKMNGGRPVSGMGDVTLATFMKEAKGGEQLHFEKADDRYADAAQADKGGIDLNPAALDLETRGDGGLRFEVTPQLFEEYRSAAGLVPVIISLEPAVDLPKFLGIETQLK
jgi:DNA-binding transcriptional MerR regulator